jgi:Domain of unknown function DUF29
MAVKEQQAAVSPVSPDAGYDADFFQWTQSTAEMIRQGRLAEVDLEHVAEEIEAMGRRDRREVRSRLIVLMLHLLKWEFQSELRSPSWRSTISEQRTQIQFIIEDSPSLRRVPSEQLSDNHRCAVEKAIEETGMNADRFPPACPYTAEQILDRDFFPEGR